MATPAPKILAQKATSATTAVDLYTVPALTATVISTIVVCNRGAADTTYRLYVAPAGAATTNDMYIAYDVLIAGNSMVTLTIGATLATTDVFRVYAGNGNLTFNLFGVELS